MKIDAILLNQKDNVATAVQALTPGTMARIRSGDAIVGCLICETIPYGHKFAVADITTQSEIYKYGEVIGRSTQPIGKGCHAHVQNIESLRGRGDRR